MGGGREETTDETTRPPRPGMGMRDGCNAMQPSLALALSLSLSASSGFRDTHHAAEEVSNSNSE